MSGKQRAEVTYDYGPENEDELRLGVGDIIQNVKQAEEGWMEGTLNGKRGLFPDNFVKLLPAEEAPPSVPDGGPAGGSDSKTFYAKVTYSYEADNEDELSLDVGKVVEVLGDEEEGWWKGKLGDRVGVFPENFVERMTDQEAEAHRKKLDPNKTDGPPPTEKAPAPKAGFAGGVKLPFMMPPGGAGGGPKPHPEPAEMSTDPARGTAKVVKATVSFDYVAEADDELNLTKGDVIEITSQVVSDGWWEGKCYGKVGVFPCNFVELLPEELAQPAAPKKVPKVSMLPGLTPGDLKKASEAKADAAHKRAEAKKADELPPQRPAKPGPPGGARPPGPSAPKVLGKPGPPAAKRQQPGLPGKKPADKPEQDEPKKPPALRPPVAGSRRSADVSAIKDDGDSEPAVKPSQPAKRHMPEPAKPAAPEESIPPWKKELAQKRKNTGESGPPAPSKPEPVKEPPAPTPAPAPAPAPVVNKPAAAKPVATKPPQPATVIAAPPVESKAPPPAKIEENDTASGVSSAEVAAVKEDIAKLQKKMADMETNFVAEIERLEQEIDDEKKSRMNMQVEIDRLKKAEKRVLG